MPAPDGYPPGALDVKPELVGPGGGALTCPERAGIGSRKTWMGERQFGCGAWSVPSPHASVMPAARTTLPLRPVLPPAATTVALTPAPTELPPPVDMVNAPTAIAPITCVAWAHSPSPGMSPGWSPSSRS
jgi:hypothetical protein